MGLDPKRVASRYLRAAPASGLDRNKNYYHGTQSAKVAKSIMRRGIEPPDLSLRPDSAMRPVQGRVYLTPRIDYAIAYVLGGDMAGHKVRSRFKYGYLFVVPGQRLANVHPDEDSIGEMIYKGTAPDSVIELAENELQVESDDPSPLALYWNAQIWDTTLEAYGKRVNLSDSDERIALEEWLYSNPQHNFEEWWEYDRRTIYDQIMEGEYAAWAEGGKILLPHLTAEQEIELIHRGAHVAHAGTVKPSECWRFDLSLSPELKRNGSNFFDLAERC